MEGPSVRPPVQAANGIDSIKRRGNEESETPPSPPTAVQSPDSETRKVKELGLLPESEGVGHVNRYTADKKNYQWRQIVPSGF